jgi:peptidoglycan/LPS O-acetylase OafA/YrhL
MDIRLSRKIRNISFLLILMVAFIHGYNENLHFADQGNFAPAYWLSFIERFISDGICRIAVPLFFVISGYLASESIGKSLNFHQYLRLLRKRIYSLLFPYLLVSALGIALVVFLQLFPISRPFFNNYSVSGSGLQKWLNALLLNPVPFQLWFIRFLMGYFIAFPILFYSIRYLREFAVIALFFTWANPYLYHHVGFVKIIFFSISFLFCLLSGTDMTPYIPTQKNELEGLFFFALGIYASLHRIPMLSRIPAYLLWAAVLVWILWIAYRTAISLDIPPRHNEVHYHLIGITITGTVLFWYLYDSVSERLDAWLWLNQNAPYAFGIFLFHEPMLTIMKKGIVRISGGGDFSLLMSFLLSPVIAIILSLYLSKWTSSKLPAFYNLITGNRKPASPPVAT